MCYKSDEIIVIIFYYVVMYCWANATVLLLCPINWNFLMHFALLFLEFRCHSRIVMLFDYRDKTQYNTIQEFRSLTICVRWRECQIKGS